MKTKTPRRKRFWACSCGHCGLLWDRHNNICIAIFVGPEDEEEPIEESQRQRTMKAVVKNGQGNVTMYLTKKKHAEMKANGEIL